MFGIGGGVVVFVPMVTVESGDGTGVLGLFQLLVF
jgi:hypothetical protein